MPAILERRHDVADIIELEQVEAPGAAAMPRTAHKLIEVGISGLIAGNQLSVDDAGCRRQFQDGVGDRSEALREVRTGLAVDDDIVADLVPARARLFRLLLGGGLVGGRGDKS